MGVVGLSCLMIVVGVIAIMALAVGPVWGALTLVVIGVGLMTLAALRDW